MFVVVLQEVRLDLVARAGQHGEWIALFIVLKS